MYFTIYNTRGDNNKFISVSVGVIIRNTKHGNEFPNWWKQQQQQQQQLNLPIIGWKGRIVDMLTDEVKIDLCVQAEAKNGVLWTAYSGENMATIGTECAVNYL